MVVVLVFVLIVVVFKEVVVVGKQKIVWESLLIIHYL